MRTGRYFLGIKRLSYETNQSVSSNIEVKNARRYTSIPIRRLHNLAYLTQAQRSFTYHLLRHFTKTSFPFTLSLYTFVCLHYLCVNVHRCMIHTYICRLTKFRSSTESRVECAVLLTTK